MNIVELNNKEKESFLINLYEAFENGYIFEEFLKPFLELYNLTEVSVTKKSGDDGIDLLAIRPGVFNDNKDDVVYKIQAKRKKPDLKIGPNIVREHLGILKSGEVGIIITTGGFTKGALEVASSKPENPIILIDGMTLINFCIQNEIGFVYKPIFSVNKLNEFYRKEQKDEIITPKDNINRNDYIEKNISSNDIRARILPIPLAIFEKLPENKKCFDLYINDILKEKMKINRQRKYFAGITDVYRENNLITKDNVFNPSVSQWCVKDNNIYVYIDRK
jgi:restriction system protein